MAVNNLEINLDLKQNLNIYANCKQLDSIHLIFNIYDDGMQVDLSDYNVRLRAMKSDMVPLIQDTEFTIRGNVVTIIANEQLTTTSGLTKIELQFINRKTGEKKATFNLNLKVAASTLEVERSISTATYTLLEKLENKVDQTLDLTENIDKAIEINNKLVTTITDVTDAKNILETDFKKSGELITSLEDSIKRGNTLNTDLKTTINNSTTLKTDLDSANTQAEVNIAAIKALGDASKLAENVQININEIQLINTQLTEKASNADLNTTNANVDAKANDIDSLRTTTAKNVTGAINELNNIKANKDNSLQKNLNADMLDNLHADSFAQNFYAADADFNTLIKSGMYRFDTGNKNCPGNLNWGQLLVIHGAADTITQMCFSFSSNIAYIRMGNPPEVGGSGTWTPWKQLAVTESKPVTFLNGWYAGFASDKNYFVNVSISGKTASITAVMTSGITAVGTVICQLPAPKNRVHVPIIRQDTGASTTIYFQEDGCLKVSMGTISPNTPYVLSFSYELAV